MFLFDPPPPHVNFIFVQLNSFGIFPFCSPTFSSSLYGMSPIKYIESQVYPNNCTCCSIENAIVSVDYKVTNNSRIKLITLLEDAHFASHFSPNVCATFSVVAIGGCGDDFLRRHQ